MLTKQARLKIELRSDLCSGSGMSYAGVIDSDVIYDEWGFPYIPARRMKGCMREAAEMIAIEKNMVDLLFGRRGDKKPGSLQIGNAVLTEAESLKKEIGSLAKQDGFATLLNPENILTLYTSVRTQTRIDKNGSAEDNSLRFIRVVNQNDPFYDYVGDKKTNLCFYADISWQVDAEDKAEEMEKCLDQIANATRNIGMNRNRGLGSVRCYLEGVKDAENIQCLDQSIMVCPGDCDEEMTKISYLLKNIEPLILSEDDESGTSSYISGKSILGALAGAYIREMKANNEEDPANTEIFRDLFLSGKIQYANAYPTVDNLRSYPAPLYLNKLKKTEKYVNQLGEKGDTESENGDYDSQHGNQPKLLKTEYVTECQKGDGKLSYQIAEPEKEMVYHHRHGHPETDLEEQLYTLEYMKNGQSFAGIIYTPKKYQNILTNLLASTNLRFGKSRSAQYGACNLVSIHVEDMQEDRSTYRAGEKIIVTLKSDAIFMDDQGCYTVCFPDVKALLADKLSLKYDDKWEDDESIIQTKEVVGYNTTWNMKREAVPAVCVGSAFVYKLSDDLVGWPDFVGERTQEGFGEIEIFPSSQMEYKADVKKQSESSPDITYGRELSRDMIMILCQLLKEPLIEQLMLFKPEESFKFNSSNIGRVTLMLKESLNDFDDPDKSANDFWQRIQSIKSNYIDEAKKLADLTLTAIEILQNDEENIDGEKDKVKQYRIDPDKMAKLIEDATLKNIFDKLPDESKNNLMKEIWGEYMLQYLTQLKYECKGEK